MPNYRGNPSDYNRRQGYNQTPAMTPYTTPVKPDPCCAHDDALDGLALAMAYVPWQEWTETYQLEKAICHGTIFPDLNKPFCRIGGNIR